MNAPGESHRSSDLVYQVTQDIISQNRTLFVKKVERLIRTEKTRQEELERVLLFSKDIYMRHREIWEKEFPDSSLEQVIGNYIPMVIRNFFSRKCASAPKSPVYTYNIDELNQQLLVRLGWLQYRNWKKYGKEMIPAEQKPSSLVVRLFMGHTRMASSGGLGRNKPQEYFTHDYGPTEEGYRILKEYKNIVEHGKV